MKKNLWLKIANGPNQGRIIQVHFDQETIIGRGETTPLTIFDPRMSRRHFAIRLRDDGWLLRDLSSRNGTFVNGENALEVKLQHGDTIIAGDTVFRVELSTSKSSGHLGNHKFGPLRK